MIYLRGELIVKIFCTGCVCFFGFVSGESSTNLKYETRSAMT